MIEISTQSQLQKYKHKHDAFVVIITDDDDGWEIKYQKQLLQLVDDIPFTYIRNERLKA